MAVREVGSGKGNESLVSVGEGVVALGWFIVPKGPPTLI